VSTKFVQIKALGFKLAPLWSLYTGERLQGHDGPLVLLSIFVTCNLSIITYMIHRNFYNGASINQ
jgi:hypothetical protein